MLPTQFFDLAGSDVQIEDDDEYEDDDRADEQELVPTARGSSYTAASM
jgi:hypothetical protein